MSLLEELFGVDEAEEAEALERIIEGGSGDEELPVNPDDEAEEDKRTVDPTKPKTVRVTKNPQVVLNAARLTGPRGLEALPEHFKDFKFKGKGHEKEDLDLVLKKLEHWMHRLYPKFQFDDCMKKIESLGKKRAVMVTLHKIRSDQIRSDEFVEQRDSSDDEAPKADEFDLLIQEQIDIARANAMDDEPVINTPAAAPNITSAPSINEEQKMRILKNKQLAEERRKNKILSQQNTVNLNGVSAVNNDLMNQPTNDEIMDLMNESQNEVIGDQHEPTNEEILNMMNEMTDDQVEYNINDEFNVNGNDERFDTIDLTNVGNVAKNVGRIVNNETIDLTEVITNDRTGQDSTRVNDKNTNNHANDMDLIESYDSEEEELRKNTRKRARYIESSDEESESNFTVNALVHTHDVNSQSIEKSQENIVEANSENVQEKFSNDVVATNDIDNPNIANMNDIDTPNIAKKNYDTVQEHFNNDVVTTNDIDNSNIANINDIDTPNIAKKNYDTSDISKTNDIDASDTAKINDIDTPNIAKTNDDINDDSSDDDAPLINSDDEAYRKYDEAAANDDFEENDDENIPPDFEEFDW